MESDTAPGPAGSAAGPARQSGVQKRRKGSGLSADSARLRAPLQRAAEERAQRPQRDRPTRGSRSASRLAWAMAERRGTAARAEASAVRRGACHCPSDPASARLMPSSTDSSQRGAARSARLSGCACCSSSHASDSPSACPPPSPPSSPRSSARAARPEASAWAWGPSAVGSTANTSPHAAPAGRRPAVRRAAGARAGGVARGVPRVAAAAQEA